MTNTHCIKEHFNIYYIFKEDKEGKSLSQTEIDKQYKKILFKIKNNKIS